MSQLMKLLSLLLLSYSVCASTIHHPKEARKSTGPKVLILDGGVAGVIRAAQTLRENGIDDFAIIEARDELGGRLKNVKSAGYTVEIGANWVQGTQTGSGPENSIYSLIPKHKIKTQLSDFGSISEESFTLHVNDNYL